MYMFITLEKKIIFFVKKDSKIVYSVFTILEYIYYFCTVLFKYNVIRSKFSCLTCKRKTRISFT